MHVLLVLDFLFINNHYLKANDLQKRENFSKYIGCSPVELKYHFENNFTEGMSWKYYGKWHIDHIKPLSKFNFFNSDGSLNEKEVRSAMSLKNLQPLWAADNLKKSNKFKEALFLFCENGWRGASSSPTQSKMKT